MSGDRATRWLGRAMVSALPRDLRDEHGDDIVQLVLDRRRFGGEPRWRLWPSVIADCTVTSIRLRRERAVPYVRPVLAGAAFGIGGFALLSRAGIPGLVLLALGVLVLVLTSGRVAAAGPPPKGSAAPVAIGGAVLVAVGLGGIALFAEADPGPFLWVAMIVAIIFGLCALATAGVLALDGRRRSSTVAPA